MSTPLIQPDMGKYPYHEYLLVLKPNASVNEKILQLKEEFSKKFKIVSRNYSNPYITLVNFSQLKMMENRLINRLNTIAMAYHRFTVSLKDYGNFPSHTVFINIESKQQVKNLVKELTTARQMMTMNKEKKAHFMDDPNLTIARSLLPWQYEQSWNEYRRKHFTAHFIAESMVLLRRPPAIRSDDNVKPGKYQKVTEFQFLNLPITAQGELFS